MEEKFAILCLLIAEYMRKEFLDQVDSGGGSSIPGDNGQIVPNTLTQWEQLSSLREQQVVWGDFSYRVATQIKPLEQQYLQYVQSEPETIKALLRAKQQEISTATGTTPSRARLCARFLDEHVGSFLQSIAANNATNERRWSELAMWYDTAYGFRTVLADIQRADAALRGKGDTQATEAHLLREDQTGFTLIAASVIQLKTDAFDTQVRRTRRLIQESHLSFIPAVDPVFVEAVQNKQLPETSRIMIDQLTECVIAGAEFAQHTYQAIYHLSE